MLDLALEAYGEGAFPMGDERGRDGAVDWYTADPRALISLEDGGMYISRRLAKRVRSRKFDVRTDTAFLDVVRACAASRPGRETTWITPPMLPMYDLLFRAGHAHSVEAWLDGALVGGVYGVQLGGAFFAESKFSRPELGGTDASKVCLVHLWSHLRARRFALLDVQFENHHIEQFGLVRVPHVRFQVLLDAARSLQIPWLPWVEYADAVAASRRR